MIDTPPKDLDTWTGTLVRADLPVLRRTATELARLRGSEDRANARDIAAVVLRDPLMIAKVMAHLAVHRGHRQTTDITTVDRAIVMMGLPPFFRAFDAPPVVDERLRAHPEALLGLLRVVQRAVRACRFAKDWAVRRMDLEVEQIMIAALLHDLAEMLVWCLAPALALQVRAMQRARPGLRSSAAQRAVLGIEVIDLQLALAREWRLPELLVTMMDDRHADHPRVRNVLLAVNLARHSSNGWNDAALPDDYKAIGELLRMDPADVQRSVEPPPEPGSAPAD